MTILDRPISKASAQPKAGHRHADVSPSRRTVQVRGAAPRPQRKWWNMTARRTVLLPDRAVEAGFEQGVVVE
ncbi:hypothetical protein [Nocardia brasiliensis]|uniref:hypothetical protein n=1 Tax=Nocardia brasiliensis TaxID=37326 RepID=UPI0036705012